MEFELKVARGYEVELLTLQAEDVAQAQRLAEKQGYSVLAARARGGFARLGRRRARFNLTLFSQELFALLNAGLSLIEAIEAQAEKEGNVETRRILDQVAAGLYEGLPLSGVLERMPQVFPALYVALIRASERTGDMAQALGRHVAYQGQVDVVRKKIATAAIYPALLVVVGGLVMLFLLGYVVPKFSAIYESSGANLPWMSQLLLAWGKLAEERGSELLVLFVLVVGALGYVVSLVGVRRALLNQLWKIPAMGEALRIYQLARFYRTLGMLLRGGIPLLGAMEMVSSLLQPTLRSNLARVAQDVREGQSLSAAMAAHEMTTPVAVRMLRVGERTGQMGEMLERIGGFYDEEIARAIDWFTRLLEPLLMVVIGLVVGLVVVLMYMPIFELAGSIQ